jgi:hypothetical protein
MENKWNAKVVEDQFGNKAIQICQGDNVIAMTQDLDWAMLVVDLLESHRNPAFIEALKASSEAGAEGMSDEEVEEKSDLYEAEKRKRLEAYNNEEEE